MAGGGWGQQPPAGGPPPGWGHPPGGHPPQQPQYQQPHFGATVPGYEFSQVENERIAKVAFWAKALGIVGFVNAGLAMINLNIVNAAVSLGIGLLFFQGGASFSTVVNTQGNDIRHMMSALDKIGTAFLIKLILLGLAVGLMLCVMIFVVLVMLGTASL